jgi:rhodanese-related sulfurtransferase
MGLTDMLKGLFSRTPDHTISFADLAREAAAGSVTVVDVREPHEFNSGHVPDAINLPLSRFDAGKLPAGKPVVLICLAGGRSAQALGKALAAGVTDVCHYPGAAKAA